MKKEAYLVALLMTGMGTSALAQIAAPLAGRPSLHLLSASPTMNLNVGYDADLYRFDERSRTLQLIRTVVRAADGVNFILPDYDGRLLIIGAPHAAPTRLELVNMDATGTPISRKLEIRNLPRAVWEPWPAWILTMGNKAGAHTPASRATVVTRSIIDNPGGGQSLALELASDEGLLLVNVPIDNSLPSSAPEYLTVKDLIRINVAGQFGLAGLGDSDVRLVRIKQGKINLEVQGKSVDLGISAPPGMQTPAEENWRLLIHNSRFTVLHRPKDPDSSSVNEGYSPIHVWTAQSGRWTIFRVPGAIPAIKNLGGWIAGAAAVESLDRQSPGAVNRRRYSRPTAEVNSPPPRPVVQTRPVTDEMFRQSRQFYGGVLFLIDPQSGRQFQIRTDQGDSEILLVQDNYVYYRVNAKLYKAQIQGSSIGAPELVVETDAVADVHWAFFGS